MFLDLHFEHGLAIYNEYGECAVPFELPEASS
jgi:hypothetical protein